MRIEFWGDEIDSMGRFDTATQRRTEQIKSCVILPAAETLPQLAPGGIEGLCAEIESFAAKYARRRTSESRPPRLPRTCVPTPSGFPPGS